VADFFSGADASCADARGAPYRLAPQYCHAGPGRYRDLAVAGDGLVMVPDAAGDRMVVFGPGDPAPTPTGSPEPGVGPCLFQPSKVAEPDRLPLGDTTEVTLRLDGSCGSRHAAKDVAVVLDTSCQMAGERFARTRDALAALVDAMTVPSDRMALVTFDDNQGGARVLVPFTADRGALRDAATAVTTSCLPDPRCRQLDFDGLGYMRSYLYPYGCLTEGRISDGLRAGREALLAPSARPGAGKVLVLLSYSLFDSRQILATLSQDPQMFEPPFSPTEQALWNKDLPTDLILPVTDRDQARWEGWKLREAGVRMYTSGVGVDSFGAGHPPDEGLLGALAWPADGYRPAAAPADLVEVFATEGREISARKASYAGLSRTWAWPARRRSRTACCRSTPVAGPRTLRPGPATSMASATPERLLSPCRTSRSSARRQRWGPLPRLPGPRPRPARPSRRPPPRPPPRPPSRRCWSPSTCRSPTAGTASPRRARWTWPWSWTRRHR
jgi:hypothetical protein